MTDRELMQQALEALGLHAKQYPHMVKGYTADAASALRDRLAQPEQEPVAWMTINEYGEEDDIHYEHPEGYLLEGWTYKPLYTHPPTVQQEKEPLEYWNAVEGWVKIDEVREHFDSVGCGTIYKTAGEDRVPLYTTPSPCPTCEALARTEQESVAWADEIIDDLHAQYNTDGIKEIDSGDALIRLDEAIAAVEEAEKRHTTPPQRPWVGLTDDEIKDLWSWSMTREAERTATTQQHAFARTIEAKLKEKNT